MNKKNDNIEAARRIKESTNMIEIKRLVEREKEETRQLQLAEELEFKRLKYFVFSMIVFVSIGIGAIIYLWDYNK